MAIQTGFLIPRFTLGAEKSLGTLFVEVSHLWNIEMNGDFFWCLKSDDMFANVCKGFIDFVNLIHGPITI